MPRIFELFRISKPSRTTKRPTPRKLRLEQCEVRRLTAADFATALSPHELLVDSTPAIYGPAAAPAGRVESLGLAIARESGPVAAAAEPAAKATSAKIDLDVTVRSGEVTPTLAKDLNLLHFYGGEKLTVPTTIKNYGPDAAKGNLTVTVYLSTTNKLNNKSIELGSKTVSVNLGNNATTVVAVDTTVPSSLVAGQQYFVVAKITTPLKQSTINDERASDRKFEFVGTPTHNPAAFQPDANGKVLYFDFVRDTLNNRLAAVDRDITVRINDPKSFIGSFEGDALYPYLKNGNPTIGMGLNLNALDLDTEHLVASAVRSYYQQAYGQKLTGSDASIILMLITQAYSGSTKQAISAAQGESLFAATYPDRQAIAEAALGKSIWSRVNPLAKIAVMDQVYATGGVQANMLPSLKALDYVRAGFDLVDNARTTQSAAQTIRVKAEYQNLLYATRSGLGSVR